jgi:hypothetical protein
MCRAHHVFECQIYRGWLQDYYARPDGAETNSDVVLDLPGPGNNTAFGHCTVAASGIGVRIIGNSWHRGTTTHPED